MSSPPLPDWINAAADEIAGSTNCCDIQSSSATMMAEVIRRHAPAIKWQPIETAPKETLVLCYDSKCDCPVVALTLTAVFTALGRTRMMWRDYSGDSYQGYEPTHWMPLPDPPSPAHADWTSRVVPLRIEERRKRAQP